MKSTTKSEATAPVIQSIQILPRNYDLRNATIHTENNVETKLDNAACGCAIFVTLSIFLKFWRRSPLVRVQPVSATEPDDMCTIQTMMKYIMVIWYICTYHTRLVLLYTISHRYIIQVKELIVLAIVQKGDASASGSTHRYLSTYLLLLVEVATLGYQTRVYDTQPYCHWSCVLW